MSDYLQNKAFTLNIANPYGFDLEVDFILSGFSINSLTTTGILIICNSIYTRYEIINSSEYTIIDEENNRVSLRMPVDSIDYQELEEGKTYTWSFSVFDSGTSIFRAQGDYKSLLNTGKVIGEPHEVEVEISTDITAQIFIPQGAIGPQGEQGIQGEIGPQGEQGEIGPAGPWYINEQVLVTSSTPNLSFNFYTLLASGTDIIISSPDPEQAYIDGISTVRVLSRPLNDDSGSVGLSGWGLTEVFYLQPGESLLAVVNYINSEYVWSLHNTSPDIIIDGSSSTESSGFLKIDFNASDLSTPLSIGIPPTGRYILDIDINDIVAIDGATFSVGTLTNPGLFFSNIPATKNYTFRAGKVSTGDEIFLSASNLSLPNIGSGSIVITYI